MNIWGTEKAPNFFSILLTTEFSKVMIFKPTNKVAHREQSEICIRVLVGHNVDRKPSVLTLSSIFRKMHGP